ncbi:hypothetical protein Tdes44962_MAKER06954 [Teratosphaeria destructans]|uniref:Uncharacterized protein n=1 Tax=Teratosphaeria destructans TaxID=418781 RepID=A0A9W7T0H8_9PEZI|nr:hypothetical protein Tdes44962_MAKER06954 [Teratosphaeria destructans]
MPAVTPKPRLAALTSSALTRPPHTCMMHRRTFAAHQPSSSSSSSNSPPQAEPHHDQAGEEKAQEVSNKQHSPHKTVAQMDEELRQKMAGHAGDGGEAGIEYEDGQPVSMKRSVKNNMFRYI